LEDVDICISSKFNKQLEDFNHKGAALSNVANKLSFIIILLIVNLYSNCFEHSELSFQNEEKLLHRLVIFLLPLRADLQ
jgi:hypothetical protein